MPFINPATVERIRQELISDPTPPMTLLDAFHELDDTVGGQMPRMSELLTNVYGWEYNSATKTEEPRPELKLSYKGRLLVFCCALAADLVPWGRSARTYRATPAARSLRSLLTSAQLHCGAYVLLAMKMFRAACPASPELNIWYVGWDTFSDALNPGVHAQLFLIDNGNLNQDKKAVPVPCILDPTYSLVVSITEGALTGLTTGQPGTPPATWKIQGVPQDRIIFLSERGLTHTLQGEKEAFEHYSDEMLTFFGVTHLVPPPTSGVAHPDPYMSGRDPSPGIIARGFYRGTFICRNDSGHIVKDADTWVSTVTNNGF